MRIWNVSGWGHSIANQLASQKGLVAGHQIAFPGREALLDDERQSGPKPESCSDFYSKLGAALLRKGYNDLLSIIVICSQLRLTTS